MGEIVFRDYDQEALDLEYDNRRKVADFQDYLDRYASSSAAARAEITCERNIAYDENSDVTLDIFHAERSAVAAPVQIYIHGGYWRALSKQEHSFVALGLVPHGITTVVIDYDLMPAVRMDVLVRQCRQAVVWVHRHAAEIGGDADNIHLSGHSAGGHLTAMVAATDWRGHGDLPLDTVKSACGLSGLYDLEPIRLCFLNQELEMSEAEARANSPTALTPATLPPLRALVGSDEGPEYLRQSNNLAAHWSGLGHDAQALEMAGLNHFSIAAQMEDPESDVIAHLRELMGIGRG